MSDMTPYEEDLPEMTRVEAERLHADICNDLQLSAFKMYRMKILKGFRQLGYSSFEPYCEDCFGMIKSTADNWMVRVRVYLIAHGISAAEFSKGPTVGPFEGKLLSVRISRALNNMDSQSIATAWKMLHTSGAVNLPVVNQLEEVQRWGRRTGLIEPSARRVVQDEEGEETSPVKGFRVLGNNVQEVRADGTLGHTLPPVRETEECVCPSCDRIISKTAERCETCYQEALEDNQDDPPEESFFAPPQAVPAPRLPALAVAPPYLRQTPPDGLTDNGRRVIGAVCAVETDYPEIVYIRCIVPKGMALKENDPLTVAIVLCQLP